jgi:TolB protein
MNADGSDQRRLTFKGNYNQTPRWSPRGDQIAFTARDERKVFDVFLVSPETGKISRVTQDQGLTNEEPSWAPNGRLLVLVSDRGGRQQLVVTNPAGDRQKVVTSAAAGIAAPVWGPFAP